MHIWKLIPHHEEPAKSFELFCEQGCIAVGWSDIGDLQQRGPKSASEIAVWIGVAYPELKNRHLGGPSLWNFMHHARPGDHVLISAQGTRYGVFEILGDYEYVSESEGVSTYRHCRRAALTNIDPEALWQSCGGRAAPGHAVRWTMALLAKSAAAEQQIFEEGQRNAGLSTVVERNPKARSACLAHHGTKCLVCGFSGEETFGQAGKDLIHVHHLTEVSTSSGVYSINPVTDLIPLCPTCHSMAHRRKPAFTMAELQQMRLG